MKVSYSILKRSMKELNCSVEKICDILTAQGFVVENVIRSDEIFSTELFAATVMNRKIGITSGTCTVQFRDRTYDIKCEKWGIPEIGQRVLVNCIGDAISAQPLRTLRNPEKEEFLISLPVEIPEGAKVYQELVGDDWVFDIEITANRADCLSILGLVREIAVGLDLDYTLPPRDFTPTKFFESDFHVTIVDHDLCSFYSGRQVKNITIHPSPWWIIHELYLLGSRPINNVVDVTNLVMLETGQPLHAFDATLIADRIIKVRRAKNGETLVTLDGVERKLKNTMLVIADSSEPIALAGIMGGYQSEVSPATQEIILEAAIFKGVQVRKTARELGLRTEASSRFERGVDPGAVLNASQRALYLLKDIDPSILISHNWSVCGEAMISPSEIEFSPSWVGKIMNCDIPRETMEKIMKKLGFLLLSQPDEEIMRVKVPTWRPDVSIPIDCVEEIGRIFGYEYIQSQLPNFSFDPGNKSRVFHMEEKIRQYLVSRGLKETVTLSLTSQANYDKLSLPKNECIQVNNPLSQDHVILRPDLIITALDILKTNVVRGRENFGFFECGEVFSRRNEIDHPYHEEKRCVIVLNGHFYPSYWQKCSQVDIHYLKGLVENLCELMGYPLSKLVWKPLLTDPYFDPTLSFSGRTSTGKELFRGGLIKKSVGDAFELWGQHFCLEIAWEKIIHELDTTSFQLQEIKRYPSIRRDVSIIVDEERTWEKVQTLINHIASSSPMEIETIELFDSYQGGHLPKGKKAFSFMIIFRSNQRTLTDYEVDGWIGIIKNALKKESGIVLREDLTGGA